MKVLSAKTIYLPVNGAHDDRTCRLTHSTNDVNEECVSAKLKVESESELDKLANALPYFYEVYDNAYVDSEGNIWLYLFVENLIYHTERTTAQTIARELLLALASGAADAIGMTASDVASFAFYLENFANSGTSF